MNEYKGKPEWAQSRREKANAARIAEGLPPRRRRWPWVLLILIVLGIAGYVVYTMFMAPPPPAAPEPEPEPAALVMQINTFEVATVTPQRLTRTVRVSGPMNPLRQTQISAEVGGEVSAVNVRPGDRVEQGDVLVQISTRDLEIQLEQQRSTAEATRAQLELAESQLERTRTLIERGLAPSSGLEEAETQAAALRANLAALDSGVTSAENALAKATITAPFAGIISSRSVQPGQTIGAGSGLVGLVDLSVLEFQASAPVSASTSVATGQDVMVTVEGFANRSFVGTVSGISPVAIEGTRSIPIFVTLENEDGLLRGGMFATGQIIVDDAPDAIAVATPALREDDEGTYVLVVEGDRVVRRPVEVGPQWNNGDVTQILSGLEAGETVVSAALPEVNPGDLVELVDF